MTCRRGFHLPVPGERCRRAPCGVPAGHARGLVRNRSLPPVFSPVVSLFTVGSEGPFLLCVLPPPLSRDFADALSRWAGCFFFWWFLLLRRSFLLRCNPTDLFLLLLSVLLLSKVCSLLACFFRRGLVTPPSDLLTGESSGFPQPQQSGRETHSTGTQSSEPGTVSMFVTRRSAPGRSVHPAQGTRAHRSARHGPGCARGRGGAVAPGAAPKSRKPGGADP